MIVGLTLAAVCTCAATSPLAAQTQTRTPTPPWTQTPTQMVEGRRSASGELGGRVSVWPEGAWKVGGSLGIPGVRTRPYPGAFTLGVHAHYFPTGPLGLEGSLGLAPMGLMRGALLTGGRAGVTVPLRTRSVLVLPSGGVSFLAGATPNGLDAGPGLFYAGLTTISVAGLRLGATVHWRHLSETPVWLIEFGGIRL